ncbi:hypothetical protein P170DRAFT_510134 [Aspergillus steynii IBT 23096]|uniref:Protein kinase domain-containing protein n=1 Tax=Aspergillus steynii IBT 23096 TaxID=1392250 RepID=A0A2I2G9Q4_9EURO|nr:uncharacterized protein P170DRAFT_510134 [Aspergillus steynii IBT 23096]PLB49605.1 hypothetical protein P170DRAFT_510134 [Aspergillus steynii IBT 23096]
MNPKPELIGLGRVGCVMRHGEIAVKTANKWPVPDNASEYTTILHEQTNRTNEEALIHEGRIYEHLQSVEGVLKPHHISDTEIRMPYIGHRSLDRYMSANKAIIGDEQRLAWFQNAADIISRVHGQRVIVADIATRNFLVNKDLSLQLCDFSESVIIPEDRALDEFVSEDFLSVKFDIARFGSMMYEIVSGSRYEFYVNPDIDMDLDDDESKIYKEWPTSKRFPDTSNVFLGDIIRKCWLRDGFRSMKDVEASLDWRHYPIIFLGENLWAFSR